MWHAPQILVLHHLLAWSMATSLATVPMVSLTLRQRRLVGLSTTDLRTTGGRPQSVPTALCALRGGSSSDGSFPLPSGTLGDESDESSLPTLSTSSTSGTSLPDETFTDATPNGSSETLLAPMEATNGNLYATATTSPVPKEALGLAPSPPGGLRSKFPHWPWHKLPNALTVARCLAIPLFLVVFYAPLRHSHVWTSVLFALASATDYLDGYLARKWDVSTPFGAFLDPVVRVCLRGTCLRETTNGVFLASLSIEWNSV
jgi:CDP-alcohol phosphatidyltransferase